MALTMLKKNLVAKLYGKKRCELWWCEKAAFVKNGTKVVHLAGRFVGEFRVVAAKKFKKLRDALQWRPHTHFWPDSSSLEATVEYYRNLMSKNSAAEGKCELYAWEDVVLSQYVVEGNRTRVPWVYAKQRATI